MSVQWTDLGLVLLVPCLACGLLTVGCASGGQAARPPSEPRTTPAAEGHEWVVPAEASALQNPVPSSPQALNRGQSLFQRHCSPCHGAGGRGDGPVAGYWKELPKDLGDPARQDRLSDGEIFWKLSKGHRQGADVIMPAFSERLPSSEDRWRIVLYVRTLRAGASPEP
jgi:mono/diheme cytochrome c family protein